jgi:PIN domain nuclease of toxin-antitoxin system
VTLLDSFALIAFTLDEPAAEQVDDLLRTSDAEVTSVNFTEVVDVLERVRGLDSLDVHEVFDPLLAGILSVVPVTEEHAWRAADLRRRYYHRTSAALSLADCIFLAAARSDLTLATADPVIARTARSEGLNLIALPDSQGRLP